MTHKRRLGGVVVSNGMQGSVVVKVTTKKPHPLYKKVIQTWKKYHADSNGLDLAVGDVVTIQEARAMSKTKKWLVISKA